MELVAAELVVVELVGAKVAVSSDDLWIVWTESLVSLPSSSGEGPYLTDLQTTFRNY